MQYLKNIPLSLQEMSELSVPVSDAIQAEFNKYVSPHLRFHREKRDFSTDHYLIYSLKDGEAISFLYFTVVGPALHIVAGSTLPFVKRRGYMKKQLQKLFDSDLAKKTADFEIYFAPFTSEERVKFHDYVVAWFEQNGPSKKWLYVSSTKGPKYYVAA